ncbi:MAG: glycosyltransferase family 4 protein, partial [Acidimicrobiales bacterium]
IGSPMADFVMEQPEPKILNYHNITPAKFLMGWEPAVVKEVMVGRLQLTRMARIAKAGIADSRFNESELRDAGYSRTAVSPLLVDLTAMDQAVDERAFDELQLAKEAGGADLLFVGRVLPHKAHHDLIKTLVAYRELYDPRARLHLVGGVGSALYRSALAQFVGELGLEEAVDFAGSVSGGELSAYYRSADAFVCCSDHEGFCVPLIEAMHHHLPVVAYGAAAVPETLEGVGLVLKDKSPTAMAAAVHRVIEDGELRKAMVSAGDDRLRDYALGKTRAYFSATIEQMLGAIAP